MKKLTALLLALAMVLALCACGQEASVPETDEPVPAEEVTPTPEPIMPDGPVDGDGIYDCFARAMTAMIPEVTLDVSKMTSRIFSLTGALLGPWMAEPVPSLEMAS